MKIRNKTLVMCKHIDADLRDAVFESCTFNNCTILGRSAQRTVATTVFRDSRCDTCLVSNVLLDDVIIDGLEVIGRRVTFDDCLFREVVFRRISPDVFISSTRRGYSAYDNATSWALDLRGISVEMTLWNVPPHLVILDPVRQGFVDARAVRETPGHEPLLIESPLAWAVDAAERMRQQHCFIAIADEQDTAQHSAEFAEYRRRGWLAATHAVET